MEIKPEGLDRPGEQAEQRLDPFDRRVAMTMAIIAAVLACVTMLSHRAHDESLSLLAEANRLTTAANCSGSQTSQCRAISTCPSGVLATWLTATSCSPMYSPMPL